MRLDRIVFASLISLLFQVGVAAQDISPREVLAMAEFSYPSADVPSLFAPGTASAAFSEEPEDRRWSADMEAQILLEVSEAQTQGLVLRRADVECRTSSCALLLVHASPTSAVKDLIAALRENLDFGAVGTSDKNVPIARNGTTQFVLGHSEIVLVKQ